MDPRIIVFSGLLLLGILLSVLFTIFFLWPRRGKRGADYVDFNAAFFASCWFLMLLFNNSIFGYVAYVSGLTWLLLVIVHQKFPLVGRDWMGGDYQWLAVYSNCPPSFNCSYNRRNYSPC
jgi:hypothetical protein